MKLKVEVVNPRAASSGDTKHSGMLCPVTAATASTSAAPDTHGTCHMAHARRSATQTCSEKYCKWKGSWVAA